MITQNAINVAHLAMAEAIEKWLASPAPTIDEILISQLERRPMSTWTTEEMEEYSKITGQEYQPEELVARGQVLPIAEPISAQNTKASK